MGYNSTYNLKYLQDLASMVKVVRVEQMNNFSKSTLVDSRCNEICRIFVKNWLEVG